MVPLVQHAGVRLPRPWEGSSSADQEQLGGGQAMKYAEDGQVQRQVDHPWVRKWQRIPGRQADRLYQSRVFPGEYVPVATDGSMPIGFDRLFIFFV